MDDELLRGKGFNPTLGKVAFVDGYGLRIGARATLVKSENERSYGLIMNLSEEEIGELYSDPSVADYIPESVEAMELNGATCKVTSYNLPISNASVKAVRSSVMWTCLMDVTVVVSVGSVKLKDSKSPCALRLFAAWRSSVMCTLLIAVIPATKGSSVNVLK